MANTNTVAPIPLSPFTDFDSLEAAAAVNVKGLINRKPAQGGLNGLLAINGDRRRVTVSGSLLGEIAAQIGGQMVGLFTPSTVDLYHVPGGAYIVINALFAICLKPDAPKAVAALEEMSPESLLAMLTRSDVARGRSVGQEMMNGRTVRHYVIDGEDFLAAAKKSSDPQLRSFAEGLWAAGDADLYVDVQGSYPVAFRGSYSGAYEPLKFAGLFDVQIELTGVNTNPLVKLPPSCDKPIAM
jgi:hypothetical protein